MCDVRWLGFFLFLPFPRIHNTRFELNTLSHRNRSRNQFNLLKRKIERSGAFSHSLLYLLLKQQFVWYFLFSPSAFLSSFIVLTSYGWTWLNEWIWHLKIYCFVSFILGFEIHRVAGRGAERRERRISHYQSSRKMIAFNGCAWVCTVCVWVYALWQMKSDQRKLVTGPLILQYARNWLLNNEQEYWTLSMLIVYKS